MNAFMNVMHTTTCNCAACAPVPTLGIKMPYEEEKKAIVTTGKGRQKLVVGRNDLASQCPKAAEMWSSKNRLAPTEVFAGSGKKAFFVCQNCGREFSAIIQSVVRAVNNGGSGCNECARRENGAKKATIAAQKNSLAVAYPKIAAMWSPRNEFSPSEVAAKSNKSAIFVCPECGREFVSTINNMVAIIETGNIGCKKCSSKKGGEKNSANAAKRNNLAEKYPQVITMWSDKNDFSPMEVSTRSHKKAILICQDCNNEFVTTVAHLVDSLDAKNARCDKCGSKSGGQKNSANAAKRNSLAAACPQAVAMWSNKNKCSPMDISAGSGRKAIFICPDCGNEFTSVISSVVNSINLGTTGCNKCACKRRGEEIAKNAAKENCLAKVCPQAAAMWSSKNEVSPMEVSAGSGKSAILECSNCHEEFTATISRVVKAVQAGNTGCNKCKGERIGHKVSENAIKNNCLAVACPQIVAMWSDKNDFSPMEVSAGSNREAIFVCPNCKREFVARINHIVDAIKNNNTGCFECGMKKINAVSMPEQFVVRLCMAFAGENGIPNPFFDVRCILGENSRQGLDFVDHVQKCCMEYNGIYSHKDEVEKDRAKFDAVHKAGYLFIRVVEPGLEILDEKYDIVMPKGFYRNGRYNAKIMEEIGCKVIHLLEEIYGRKASPEIWALNNFKEFEVWYKENKKKLEGNAQNRGPKGKTAAKKAV